MATELRIRRGTTAENDAFTGAEGELTFDTERQELRVHDGETEGGIVVAMTNAGQPVDFAQVPQVNGSPLGAVLLSDTVLSGAVGTGTTITFPSEYVGNLLAVNFVLYGGVGDSTRPIILRLNGDTEDNYRGGAYARTPDNEENIRTSQLSNTSFCRIGYLGRFTPGSIVGWITPGTTGDTGSISFSATGWGNAGSSGSFLSQGGGRWNGSTQPFVSFTLRTDSTSDEWRDNSRVTAWGYLV